MLRRQQTPSRRSGAATVELALVMSFLMVPLLIGVWEMGRAVQVQQIVTNAAREGARLASQGRTINQNGTATVILTNVDPVSNVSDLPNVKAAVFQTLFGAGLTELAWDDVTVTFEFTDWPAGSTPGATEPWQGVKNQKFKVVVSIPFEKVRWVNLGLVNPEIITFTVEWRMMVDDPFTVNDKLPPW
jgi:Flp pilus assembly protein TadG